jgi:UDP-N-acetylmuramoylalanine--D-glutamate ligase
VRQRISDVTPLESKCALVLGLGRSGQAAADLLVRRGARVVVVDTADTPQLQADAASLRARGVQVQLGATEAPAETFDLVVVSPGVPANNPVFAAMTAKGVRVIGEFELGFEHSLCLNIGITGTNGKTTTTQMVERLLTAHRLKTIAAGNIGTPVCSVVEQTRDLDFLTLEVSSFQLETIQFWRPSSFIALRSGCC